MAAKKKNKATKIIGLAAVLAGAWIIVSGSKKSVSGIGRVLLSRHDAFELAEKEGIEFTGNYFRDVPRNKTMYLAELAKLSGYRNSPNSPMTLSRAFYNHLYKKYGQWN